MHMLGRIRIAAGAMVIVVFAGGAVSAVPLLPAAISMSRSVTDATPIRWRGYHGGGAGLAAGFATGLIIGGLLAAPQYYDEPYPYYYGYYPPRYVGPIGYGAPA